MEEWRGGGGIKMKWVRDRWEGRRQTREREVAEEGRQEERRGGSEIYGTTKGQGEGEGGQQQQQQQEGDEEM